MASTASFLSFLLCFSDHKFFKEAIYSRDHLGRTTSCSPPFRLSLGRHIFAKEIEPITRANGLNTWGTFKSLPSRNTKLFASHKETARSRSTSAITWHTPHTSPPRLPRGPEGVRLVKPHLFKWTFITLSWQFSWLQISNGSPWVTLLISLFCSWSRISSI